MKKVVFFNIFLLFTAIFVLIFPYDKSLAAKKKKEPELVGAKKCKKCHNKKSTGKQYSVWKNAKHAKSFELLATDAAKEVAKKLGIEDPQKSGKCLKCHATAYFFTEATVSKKISTSEGVSCESCHGPGSLYKKKKIMKDREKAIASGLYPHPEKACVKCHNQESPTWKNDRYTLKDGSKVGFAHDQVWEKFAHPNPKKK